MEMFCLSKRELEAKFTKSETALIAWRSQEQSWKLEESMKKHRVDSEGQTSSGKYQAGIPKGLPERFFNENGEVDLRKVTGKEAYKYFSALGIKLPVFTR